jgi:hypothetical protein
MELRRVMMKSIPAVFLAGLLCAGPLEAQKVQDKSATPPEAEQENTLDVEIGGNGFDDGSAAFFFLKDSSETGKVKVNSTTYISNRKLRTNITIPLEATEGEYDIEVQTRGGRRGKGNSLFRVLKKGGTVFNGEDTPLDCVLMDNDYEPPGLTPDTMLSDGNGVYMDGEQRVACSTGGLAQPNTSGLVFDAQTKGPARKAIRKVDLALGVCDPTKVDCNYVPAALLTASSFEDIENVTMSAWPFPEQGPIQMMGAGKSHEVAFRIGVPHDGGRYGIQLMSRTIPEEFHQGVFCDLHDPNDAKTTEDVTVYIWPDGSDEDEFPDGYTVTTGEIDDSVTTSPPRVIPGTREAAICSNLGPMTCGGPSDGDLCNKLGTVPLQFTLHMITRP